MQAVYRVVNQTSICRKCNAVPSRHTGQVLRTAAFQVTMPANKKKLPPLSTLIQESFDEEFMRDCPSCKHPLPNRRSTLLTEATPAIVFMLGRFSRHHLGGEPIRDGRKLPLGKDLQLRTFTNNLVRYTMVSAIEHIGDTIERGHYR